MSHDDAVITMTVSDLLGQGHDPNEVDEKGATPLHYAALRGYYEVALLLIESGADVNQCSGLGTEGAFPLGTPLQTAVESKEEAIVDLFLEHGADPMRRSEAGDNPFLCSVRFGFVEIGSKLIDAGVDINRKVTLGRGYVPGESALHIATRYLHVPFVKLLLSKGALVDALDDFGRTAFDVVSSRDFQYLGLGPVPQNDINEIRQLLAARV